MTLRSVKDFLFKCIYWYLLFVTALTLVDPVHTVKVRKTGSFFADWGNVFDIMYNIGNLFTEPVKWLFKVLGFPLQNVDAYSGWFPYTTASEMAHFIADLGLGFLAIPDLFEGVINWLYLLTFLLLFGVSKVVDVVYPPVKNVLWNLIIEYVFHRKKAKTYEDALEKTHQDLSKLNTQYRSLAQQTHALKDSVITDEMTQVFNKRFFIERMRKEFDEHRGGGRTMSLIMIDIDFFKKLNDTYGHLVGDEVLKEVATTLKRFTPDRSYTCRFGGEEFAVILPGRGEKDAIEIGRTFQQQVQLLRFNRVDKDLRVTVSQGICTVDFSSPEAQKVKNMESILQLADQELYRSKVEGRNRVSINAFVRDN